MAESRYLTESGPIGWMACNPVAANFLLLLVLVAGLYSLGEIRKEVFPTFPTETFTVVVPYPGSSPEEVEQGIILRIEEALRDIIGIKEIRSEAREGVGIVTVQMEPGTEMGRAISQAKVRVDGIASFPQDSEEPVVEEVKALSPAMRVSLSGNIDERRLKQLLEQVREEILALGSITEISILGDKVYEISIEVSDAQLRLYGLDFDQVVNTIRNHSRDLPGGQMRTDQGVIKLRSVSQAYVGEEFEDLTLLSRADGTRIKLGDIAGVKDRFEEQPVLSLLNGQPAMTLVVDRVGNQDVLDMTEQLREYIAQKQAVLPDGVNIEGWQDYSKILEGRIDLMLRNAFQGAILVIIALALFLDLSLALWVIVGVPFAILATIATIQILGLPVSINVLSVFAFILVLGILVDDGIVTAESAYARLEAEQQGVHSIVGGVRRIATATIFGALTTVIAFGPTLFITEGFARVMVHMGPVVMLCVVYSLIETKLVLPAHLRHVRVNGAVSGGWRGPIERLQRRFSSGIKALANGFYKRALGTAVRHRYTTLSIFIAALVICLALIPSGIVRLVFFPSVPADDIQVRLDMPQGTPWSKTHDYARRIEIAANEVNERFIRHDKDGRSVIERILVISESDTSAQVDIELLPSEQRDVDSVELAQWLREALGPLEGTRSFSINAQAGPGGVDLQAQLRGRNLEQLRQAASELKLQLANVNGVQDVRDSFKAGGRELDIHVTPEGEALGLGDVELARQVRQAFFGAEIQRVQRGRHEVRVYVRLPEAERTRIDTLQSMWIRLPDGRKVPFSVVGELRERSGLSSINRIDRQRVVNVEADINRAVVEPGDVADSLDNEIIPKILARYPELTYQLGGQAEDQRDTSTALQYGLIVVLLLIYAALAIPLKSYLQPLLIMSVIPFGVIGAILGHLVLGMDVSILSIIGIIGLIGVVVNDSLVLVDFINHYIDEGKHWKEAVMEAGPIRFRAVILTSITTFIGLLPIQLETSIQAQFVKPMATSVAFGVLFATVVTLFLVPTLFYIAKDIRGLFIGSEAVESVAENR